MKTPLSRREILAALGGCAAMASMPLGLGGCSPVGADVQLHPAKYWKEGKGEKVTCQLCPNQCVTSPGENGFCRARGNRGGKYYALTFGHPVAVHNDPIEKKPLNHYLPGTFAMSVGLTGCNLRCKHCQNWEISQAEPGSLNSRDLSADALVDLGKKAGSATLAFTYNEPTTYPEYILDCAAAAKKKGMGAVMISNGFINPEPHQELMESLTGYKVDLKGFSEKFYRDICSASLKPVQESLVRLKKKGLWFEIVNLMIPTLNDDETELAALAKWVTGNLGKDVPIHFTRFHPMYKIRNLPPTPVSTLEKAREIAKSHGVNYAYVGNVPGHKYGNTYCPGCGELLIKRYVFQVETTGLKEGKCTKCGIRIPGVWANPV